MDQRFQAFILTAENLSMSKAAELAFVSHQCISGQIRSIESEYNVQLFNRRPHLSLTVEGQKLLETLYEIRVLENNIKNSLSGPQTRVIGKVALGIPMSRYSFLVPSIVTKFRKMYPNVEIMISEDFSHPLALKVERGMLDMAMVVQERLGENLISTYTKTEHFFALIPERLLQQTYGLNNIAAKKAELKNGISIKELSRFPMLLYPPTSRLRTALDTYGKRQGIKFINGFESNRIEIFNQLTKDLQIVSMIPKMVYSTVEKENELLSSENQVHCFPVDCSPLDIPLNISLIHHKNTILTDYKRDLQRVVIETIEEN